MRREFDQDGHPDASPYQQAGRASNEALEKFEMELTQCGYSAHRVGGLVGDRSMGSDTPWEVSGLWNGMEQIDESGQPSPSAIQVAVGAARALEQVMPTPSVDYTRPESGLHPNPD
jgi:hypothetical protein